MHERKEKHKGVQCNYNQTVWHAFVPHACLCVSCAFVYALRNVFILCSVCITVIPEWSRVSVLCRGLVQPCQCECRGLTAFTAPLCMCVCVCVGGCFWFSSRSLDGHSSACLQMSPLFWRQNTHKKVHLST